MQDICNNSIYSFIWISILYLYHTYTYSFSSLFQMLIKPSLHLLNKREDIPLPPPFRKMS